MIKENQAEFNKSNITIWHEGGYKGKGITIAVLDDRGKPHDFTNVEVPFPEEHREVDHNTNVCSVIREVAPDIRIISFPWFGLKKPVIDWIFAHKEEIDVINCSFSGTVGKNEFMRLKELDIPIVCSSGNNSNEDRVSKPAEYDWTIAVGAVAESNGQVVGYSNGGKELDAVAYTNIYIPSSEGYKRTWMFSGTSCSAPKTSAMLGIYLGWRKEKNLPQLSRADIRRFIHDNAIDMYEGGHDSKSGYGLFVLPKEIPILNEKELDDKVIEEMKKPIENPTPITPPIQMNPSNIKLIIDCGHGGSDAGASSFGYYEKDLTLIIGRRVQELLREFKPAITRVDDKTLEPSDRVALIKNKYDYCLSIHLNAGKGNGVEAIHSVFSSKGKELATNIVNKLSSYTELPLRSKPVFTKTLADGKDYYFIHRDTGNTTSVIVECLFLDNADNIKKLNIEQIAQAIADGFKEFVGTNIKEPLTKPVEKPVVEVPVKNMELLDYKTYQQKGSKGIEVEKLQMTLKMIGYPVGNIDGIFGNQTYNAVVNFQRTYGLVADGIAGRATYAKINEVLSRKVEKTIYRTVRRFDSDIHILELDSNKYHVDIDLGQRGKLEKVSTIIQNKLNEGKKVVAGINAGFFNFDGSSEHLGMYIDEGLYYTPPSQDFVDLIYFKDGHTEVHNHHGYDKNLLSGYQGKAYWAVGTSYSLIQVGKINLENSNKFDHANVKNPRTMIGQKQDGTFLMVVADGRTSKSSGLTVREQAEIMLELGCYNAVNLDGGGSSTMVKVENNKPRIMNKPSDVYERPVGSVFIVYEK